MADKLKFKKKKQLNNLEKNKSTSWKNIYYYKYEKEQLSLIHNESTDKCF